MKNRNYKAHHVIFFSPPLLPQVQICSQMPTVYGRLMREDKFHTQTKQQVNYSSEYFNHVMLR